MTWGCWVGRGLPFRTRWTTLQLRREATGHDIVSWLLGSVQGRRTSPWLRPPSTDVDLNRPRLSCWHEPEPSGPCTDLDGRQAAVQLGTDLLERGLLQPAASRPVGALPDNDDLFRIRDEYLRSTSDTSSRLFRLAKLPMLGGSGSGGLGHNPR